MSEETKIKSVCIWIDSEISMNADDEPDIFYSLPDEYGYDSDVYEISIDRTHQMIEVKTRPKVQNDYIEELIIIPFYRAKKIEVEYV